MIGEKNGRIHVAVGGGGGFDLGKKKRKRRAPI